ncbi:MAG: DNRLRE domain-containing protein [bacterium]|nr:DNRLRE domain-containing protein [bacterium]
MKLFRFASLAVLLLSIVCTGCLDIAQPTAPAETESPFGSLFTILPSDAEIVSVSLNVYLRNPSYNTVYVHRVTEAWEEMDVTWNSFNNAFAAESSAEFDTNAIDWRSIDITDLAIDWMNGTVPNYGIALVAAEGTESRCMIPSREYHENHPFVEVVYVTSDGEQIEQALPLGDTFIDSDNSDMNYGTIDKVYSGHWEIGTTKTALIQFDIPELTVVDDTCTRTRKWWKRHAGSWSCHGQRPDEVSALLPITLGTPDGEFSIEVTDIDTARRLLNRRICGYSNGMTKLYGQLLAAKLNIASGAAGDEIADEIAIADEIVAGSHWSHWWTRMYRSDRQEVRQVKRAIRHYNVGTTGPGRCE